MRALILHGAGDLRLEDVPDPVAGPGEIVIEVTAALTCATDAKMLSAGAHPALGPLPAPLGHEVAGVVRQVGEGVARVRTGDAVVVANSAPCLDCPACRGGRPNLCRRMTYLTGAFAERLRVPAAIVERNVHPLPAGLPPELGAAAEPLACAVHTVRGCGALAGGGVQGQFIARLAARAGARVTLLDPHADRREMALRNGAERSLPVPADDDAVAALGREAGAGLVIEAVGRPAAWRMAVRLAQPGGEVVFHGGCPAGAEVMLPSGPIHYSELTLRGAYHHTPEAFAQAVAIIAADPGMIAELLHTPIGLAGVAHALSASRGVKHPVMPTAVH
ncbi:MAG: alcohol dehydrogenase catalytic domain-containing protein [Thermoleophilia bacterium]|nr:alcohol dehydrogenase catalytic domain-containing protein [Thermoleophilia bacterium]